MPAADEVPKILRRGLIALWLLSAPVLCLLWMKVEPSPDQMQFDYMGWMAVQGHPFYAGSFDMNWPGAMMLHDLAIRLFGPQPWTWHLFDFGLMQAAALAAALFLRRAGFGLAPLVVLVLYPPVYVTAGGWMAGQRDIIAAGVLIGAGCAMLAPARRELPAMVLAGGLVAFAVLIRPTYLSVLVGLVVLELVPRGWVARPRRNGAMARAAALVAGFGLVVAATVLAGLWIGNLDDFYQQSFLFTGAVYAGDPPQDMVQTLRDLFLRSWHWMVLLGILGAVLWGLRDGRLGYPLLLLAGLGLAIALSYTVQRKGFGYHLGGFLPILVMLVAVAFDRMRRLACAGGLVLRGALVAMIALAVAGTAAKIAGARGYLLDLRNGVAPVVGRYDIPAAAQGQLLDLIRAGSAPGDRMVQYGTAYQIPYLAGLLPAYRFITPAVDLMTPDFPLYSAWMAEVETGLRETRPKFVLITGAPFVRENGGLRPVDGDPPVLGALLAHLQTGYRVALEGPFGTLFERAGE